jgi:hypothetical protein
MKVEAYKSQTGLTRCHNCQQLGHVWANCKQRPRCLRCEGGHLHRECPQKGKDNSTPACCNFKYTGREKSHPTNYSDCSHAKDEKCLHQEQLLEGHSPNTVHQACASRRLYRTRSTNHSSRPIHDRLNVQTLSNNRGPPTPLKQRQTDQSVPAPSVNSLPLDNMFRVVAIVQLIMAEFNGAESEEERNNCHETKWSHSI